MINDVSMKKIILFLLLIPSFAYSQELFNLEKCIALGLENNLYIKIVQNNQQIAEQNATVGNAGYLPTIDLSSGYSGNFYNVNNQKQESGGVVTELNDHNKLNQAFDAGIYLNWTIFDGLNITTNHQRLKELQQIGELNTRLAIENMIADLAAEYFNYIQQIIQYNNLQSALKLSEERLRIVMERYGIGSMSRLDMQQAKVDYNSDSSRLVKQKEALFTSRVRLNRIMGIQNVEQMIFVEDTAIDFRVYDLNKEQIWQNATENNLFLILSEREIYLSQLDLKSLQSVNYPYLRLNAGYGYNYYNNKTPQTSQQNQLGLNYGITMGIKIFDGMNRTRQQKNAKLEMENRKLEYADLVLDLKSDFSNIWMAYQNNWSLMLLEEENVKTAMDNYEIAMERYKLGDLAGIELREAQNSLLEAEERLVQAQYNTKLCEISLLQISGKITEYMSDYNDKR